MSEKTKKLFDEFWSAYPKKKSKGQAEKTFNKLKPTEELVEKMIEAIELSKRTKQWVRDDGQFIPYPSTWLNAKGWEDEIKTSDLIVNDKKDNGILSKNQKEELMRIQALKRLKMRGE